MQKPFSQACENNKQPILQRIQSIFVDSETVWEIGSGTGQHGCYFAEQLPHLHWQCTDRTENLAGINCRIKESGLANLAESIALNVSDQPWPCQSIDALFTANTLHIMSIPEVECFFSSLESYLSDHAKVCIYGPFNYFGNYTSESNEQFDQWLKAGDPLSGIRDFEFIENLANNARLELQNDFAMPANNRLLFFSKNKPLA